MEQNERGILYKFQGVTPLLELWIDSYQCILCVNKGEECWDIIREFDCYASKDPLSGKSFCKLCLPEYRKYYSGLEMLYLEHSFLPLIEWCNQNFTISNRLYFYHGPGRWVWLRSAKDFWKMKDEALIHVEPVLNEALLPAGKL